MCLTIKSIDGFTANGHIGEDPSDGSSAEVDRAALLTSILDMSSEAIMYISDDHLIRVFSRGAEEIFGYKAEEIIGRPFEMLIPVSSRSGHHKHVEGFLASDVPLRYMRGREEIKGLQKDGKEFPAEASILKVKADGATHYVVTLHDISRQKWAEAGQDRLGRILDSSLNEVYIFDAATFKCLSTNRGARESLGYTFDEMRGLRIEDVNEELDKEAIDHLLLPLRSGEEDTTVFETRHKRKDGSTYPAEVHLEMMRNENPPIIVAFIRNIDERKQHLEKLRSAAAVAEAANRSKSEFLANMSHELRTPLNAILGFSELIYTQIQGPITEPKYLEYAQDINVSGRHLLGLINSVLDLAKIDAGKFELYEQFAEVADILSSCQRILGHTLNQANILLEVKLFPTLPKLFCDERALRQILLNLLSNAIKFSYAGSAITVSVRVTEQSELELIVSDQGIGIEEEDIPTALSMFSQIESSINRRHEGTGLGLPLVASLVELHGGTFKLESQIGVGTKAIIHMPSSRLLQENDDRKALVGLK